MPPSKADGTKEPIDPRAFLDAWCAAVADALAAQLPGGFEISPATHSRPQCADPVADAPPTLTAPARFTDAVGIRLFAADGRGAAAVKFVTPDNKLDSDAALAFAVRVAALLGAGATVVVIDALPGPANWATHLHSLVGVYPMARRPRGADVPILVAAPGPDSFAVWHYSVAPGLPLPTVPVPIRGAEHLKIDLEATYLDACRRSRSSE
jgi:hypothetical protein